MAFPVRKRRHIRHLAFLLHWLRTIRPGVRVSAGATHTMKVAANTLNYETSVSNSIGPLPMTCFSVRPSRNSMAIMAR